MVAPAFFVKDSLSRREKLRWATLGAILACYLGCRWVIRWLYIPFAVALFVLFGRRGHDEQKGNKQTLPTVRATALGAVAMLLWMAGFAMLRIAPAQVLWGHNARFTAVATDYPKETAFGYSVEGTIKTELGLTVHTLFYFDSDECAEKILPSSILKGKGDFLSPRDAYPKQPDYYASNGIFAVCRSVKRLTVTESDRVSLRYAPRVIALKLQQRICALFDDETAPLLLALLTGDPSELSDSLTVQLRRTGLIHLIAVSGLHVGIIMGFVLLLPCDRRASQILAAVVIIAFCLVTGAKPSVVRATIMGLCALLLPFLGRERHPLYSLRLALLALLLHNPYSILNLGLQLSFAATFGILVGQYPLYKTLMSLHLAPVRPWLYRCKRFLCESLSLTLCALAFTLPLTVLYFNSIPLIAPLANLCVDWMLPLLFLGGMVALVVSLFLPACTALLLPLIQGVFKFFLSLVSFFAGVPLCAVSFSVPAYALWLVLVYAVLILLIARPHLRRKIPLLVAGAVVLLLCAVCLHRSLLLKSGLGAQAVDVGQGQAICFYSETQSIAVDCGGEHAGDALADTMADIGESKLDALILTHFDSDHVNGVARLMDRVQVCALYIPDIHDDSGGRDAIEALASANHIPVHCVTQDETLSFGLAQITIFAPVCQPYDLDNQDEALSKSEQSKRKQKNDNNCGLSVLAFTENRHILVTGDMDTDAELALLKAKSLPTVDALIVGHHGSATSTGEKLLKKLRPKTAVISVGAFNRYGHPKEQTLQRLKDAGCRILRTDKRGTVTIP